MEASLNLGPRGNPPVMSPGRWGAPSQSAAGNKPPEAEGCSLGKRIIAKAYPPGPSSGFVCPIAIATARALEALLSFIIGGQNASV